MKYFEDFAVSGHAWRERQASFKAVLGSVYTEHQHQHYNNPAMTLVILFSLKTMESPQNGVATHFRATPLFLMSTISLALS